MVVCSWPVKHATGASIASASTVNLANATGNTLHITGNTGPITSFGTVDSGTSFRLIFDSTPTITHHATSLILPGWANIVAAAGDVMEIVSEGSGNWKCTSYTKADGTILSVITALYDSSVPAGEDIAAGQAVFMETSPAQTAALTLSQNVCDVSANTRVSFPIFGTWVAWSSLNVNLCKFWSPSAALWFRIEWDNAGSPNGTPVTNGTGSIAAASLTSYSWATTTNGSITTWSGSVTALYGVKVLTSSFRQVMTTVTKHASSTANRCTLRDASLNILETATYSGSTATFPWLYVLQPSTVYYILNDSNGSFYNAFIWGTWSFPYTWTNLNITASYIGSDTSTLAEVTTINTVRVDITNPSLSLAGNVTLTSWTKYHLVFFCGTYGSETIHAANFYKLFYSSNHTTTRPAKLYSGSAWWSALNTQFEYASSTIFRDTVLSLTDADYSYKVAIFGISSESKTIWLFPKITIAWTNTNQTSLTNNTPYYLSGTPGWLSTSPWTNSVQVWRSNSATSIVLDVSSVTNSTAVVAISGTSWTASITGLLNILPVVSSQPYTLTVNGNVVCSVSYTTWGSITIPLIAYIRAGQTWSTTGLSSLTGFITPIV